MRNTYLRFFQLVSGVVIAGLLGTHLVVMHLNDILGFLGLGAADPTEWEPMISRASHGLWVGLYISLLAFGLYHGVYGLRTIILEGTTSARAGRVVTGLISAFGVFFFALGTYAAIALFTS